MVGVPEPGALLAQLPYFLPRGRAASVRKPPLGLSQGVARAAVPRNRGRLTAWLLHYLDDAPWASTRPRFAESPAEDHVDYWPARIPKHPD